MSELSSSLFKLTSPDPNVKVIGVDITFIGLQCKTFGIIDPWKELQEAGSRLYNWLMQQVVNPIWNSLYSLYKALKRFGLAVLDLKLPVLNLHISDLFNPNLWETVEKAVKQLYETAKDKLIAILKKLGIPWPLFKNLNSPEKELYYIIKHIVVSLWDALMKKIETIKTLIQEGLRIFDLIVYKKIVWSEVWREAVNSILKVILKYLTYPPSIEDIKRLLENFAKRVLGLAEVTYKQILEVIKNFEIKPFGKPFDWIFPINPKINFPDVDFNQILADIKLWISNFMIKIVQAFMKLVKRILNLFGINFKLPTISFPVSVCAYRFTP
jgi:signal recognition particle subunit SEC65